MVYARRLKKKADTTGKIQMTFSSVNTIIDKGEMKSFQSLKEDFFFLWRTMIHLGLCKSDISLGKK